MTFIFSGDIGCVHGQRYNSWPVIKFAANLSHSWSVFIFTASCHIHGRCSLSPPVVTYMVRGDILPGVTFMVSSHFHCKVFLHGQCSHSLPDAAFQTGDYYIIRFHIEDKPPIYGM